MNAIGPIAKKFKRSGLFKYYALKKPGFTLIPKDI